MQNKTNTDKWIEYFKNERKMPSEENKSKKLDYISFTEDFCSMDDIIKLDFYKDISDLKKNNTSDIEIINKILHMMFSLDISEEEINYTEKHIEILDQITDDIFRIQPIDCSEIIRATPHIFLEEIHAIYRSYHWFKFKFNNMGLLSIPENVDIVTESNIFGNVQNIDCYCSNTIELNDEPTILNLLRNLDLYIDKYRDSLVVEIYKNIIAYHNFLFCPNMIFPMTGFLQMIDLGLFQDQLIETEKQIKFLQRNNFIIPYKTLKNLSYLYDCLNKEKNRNGQIKS